jgi:hypothetical protein
LNSSFILSRPADRPPERSPRWQAAPALNAHSLTLGVGLGVHSASPAAPGATVATVNLPLNLVRGGARARAKKNVHSEVSYAVPHTPVGLQRRFEGWP